ncbi:NAD(P)H-hydrate dehydratase [Methylovirgula sp. 4M-Z18]|uniref:NAD(P)H-hydrate dehydratase n=1 Tax=Methylovirgula sp. 4M-Z18 TaxID=2293567 RepID=UPI000E2EA3AB|nr:NAD(P)H-hydrate dehydratase [Methylovirgula sp. 4M-Z18]RFB80464.1 NAD(P)H-hydrate dehydratase [Methylovirgula sp. 4M-Z18]
MTFLAPSSAALLTTAEMAEADRLTIAAGTPGITLMERAGAAVAGEIFEFEQTHGLQQGWVAVLCGPGNNGGDGFVVARLLQGRGSDVRLFLLGRKEALKGDAALAAETWDGPVADLADLDLAGCTLVVDALFGAGLTRALDGAAAAAVEKVRQSDAKIVAVDVPSGLDGNTGRAAGPVIQADLTVTFFRRKPGHLLVPGRVLCGIVRVADIGISDAVLETIRPQICANEPDLWQAVRPRPQVIGHKYSRGHAAVLSGGPLSTGAPRLAARAALRVGAGLVTVLAPKDALPIHAAHLTAIMLKSCSNVRELADILADPRKNAIVLGPALGVNKAARNLVLTALKTEPDTRAVVLDADALTSFAGEADRLWGAIRASQKPVVLTPHDGEFSRLFNSKNIDLKLHAKLEAARQAAHISGAAILLKGPDTVVALPDGRASIAANAPPWLATAGAGDALAGLIGGLLAQGMPAFEAVSCAVWLHGEAANVFGPGLIAEDLPEALPQVLRALM